MKTLLGFGLAVGLAFGQDPAALKKRLENEWPTYSGDYTGQRYSKLKQINTANVKGLSLAWIYHTTSSGEGAIRISGHARR